jgi:hypothetical protein
MTTVLGVDGWLFDDDARNRKEGVITVLGDSK